MSGIDEAILLTFPRERKDFSLVLRSWFEAKSSTLLTEDNVVGVVPH